MKIQEAKYEMCSKCGTRKNLISDEVYGCDQCRKPISIELNGKRHHDYLQLTVFRTGDESESHQFCSWACVLKFLPTIRTDYFINLPYLQYEADALPGQRASDFFATISAEAKRT